VVAEVLKRVQTDKPPEPNEAFEKVYHQIVRRRLQAALAVEHGHSVVDF
jgi:hypothetical protein